MLFHAENYEIKIEFVFNCVQIQNIKENYNKILNSIRNDVFIRFFIFFCHPRENKRLKRAFLRRHCLALFFDICQLIILIWIYIYYIFESFLC